MPERRARSILRALLAAIEQRTEVRLPLAAPSEELLSVARRHRLTPLLSMLDPSGLEEAVVDQCRRDRVVTVARNMFLAAAAEECARAFAAASVPVILLKGLAYEPLHGAAGARPTSDVDILVPVEARRAAFQVLDRLGFEPRAAAPGFDDVDYHEVAWTRKGVEVDLHLALAPLARCRIDYAAVWAQARPNAAGGSEARVLDGAHAAVFHALHMAIDHFDVPALYLLDLARLAPTAEDVARADDVARAWRCHRSFATARALVAEFLPAWRAMAPPPPPRWFSRRVVEGYGDAARVPRSEQLLRKLTHLDGPGYAFRYVAIQARRNAREVVERRVRKRSARERLALDRDV